MIEKVISGGQTGVDRAALDVSMRLGIPVGGWCPRGRHAEDGSIDSMYPLTETRSTDPAVRTGLNVRDSDGTLVLAPDVNSPGTSLTIDEAHRLDKPIFITDATGSDLESAHRWIEQNDIRILNVAGPKSSEHSGIYGFALRFLLGLLDRNGVKADEPGHEDGQEE